MMSEKESSVVIEYRDGWALMWCRACDSSHAVEIPEQEEDTYRVQHHCSWSPAWMRLGPPVPKHRSKES